MKRKTVTPKQAEVPQPGSLANCERCGVQLRVAETRREDSRPFRKSLTTKGLCPDCVMTQFLYNTYPVNWIIDERGPEMLLNADFMRHALFSSGVMDPKHCEMSVTEVNWERVVANWNLPVKVSKDPCNPYRMGDAKRHGLSKTFGTGFYGGLLSNSGSLVIRRDPSTGKMTANGEPVEGELEEALDDLGTLLDRDKGTGGIQ